MESTRRLVVHDTSNDDVVKVLRRLVRREPDSTEIVLVTHRPVALPGALGRRIRVLRERSPGATARVVSSLAVEGAVVVAPGRLDRTSRSQPVTISACLIVKDEERSLGACLDAVAPFVDEVVVYDTGSTDASVEIARSRGATVVEGYWDDHFGDARNRAMEHCTSDWLFFIDADEVATGEPEELKRRLGGERDDILAVRIVSTTWEGGTDGDEILVRRVARRSRVRWTGQLHEHLVAAEGAINVTASYEAAPLHLLHSGYQNTVVHEKDKRTRNVDLARTAMDTLEKDDPEYVIAASNYGRSLLTTGENDEAIDVLEVVRTGQTHPTVVLASGRAAVAVLTSMGRLDEARAWLSTMAEHGESRGNLCLGRARIALADGDVRTAERALLKAPGATAARTDRDVWGAAFDVDSSVDVRVSIDLADGRPDAALDRLLDLAGRSPERVDVAQLFTVADQTSTPWADVVAAVPEHFLDRSVRAVMMLGGSRGVELGLRWCEAFAAARPGDHRPLVAGCLLAARGDLTTALTWSVMTREAGLPQLCPVRTSASEQTVPMHERALRWALLADAFGETDALEFYRDTLRLVRAADLPALRASIKSLAPSMSAEVDALADRPVSARSM